MMYQITPEAISEKFEVLNFFFFRLLYAIAKIAISNCEDHSSFESLFCCCCLITFVIVVMLVYTMDGGKPRVLIGLDEL